MNDGIDVQFPQALRKRRGASVEGKALLRRKSKSAGEITCAMTVASGNQQPDLMVLRQRLADARAKKAITAKDKYRMHIPAMRS